MKQKTILRLIFLASMFFAGTAAHADAFLALPKVEQPDETPMRTYKGCSASAKAHIERKFDILRKHYGTILDDANLGGNKNKRRRWKRRYGRNVRNVGVKCKTGSYCKGILGKAWRIGKVKLCYDKIMERKNSDCKLLEVLAHEVGHAAGIPSHIKHNSDNPPRDKVYRIGYAARKFCGR